MAVFIRSKTAYDAVLQASGGGGGGGLRVEWGMSSDAMRSL